MKYGMKCKSGKSRRNHDKESGSRVYEVLLILALVAGAMFVIADPLPTDLAEPDLDCPTTVGQDEKLILTVTSEHYPVTIEVTNGTGDTTEETVDGPDDNPKSILHGGQAGTSLTVVATNAKGQSTTVTVQVTSN